MQNQDTHGRNQGKTAGNFTYRPNPVLARSFLICRKDHNGDVSPVGDYTVIDADEDFSLSEKKVINLLMRMNGETNLLQLGEQTKARLLFHCKPKEADDPRTSVVFYSYTGDGVSRENAILTMEGFDA